jgi:ABC-type multidrug transport system fused ATPase/permease subunit
MGQMWRWNSKSTLLTCLRAPFIAIIPLLGIYLSRTVVSLVDSGAAIGGAAASILLICGAMALCAVILNYLNSHGTRMEQINSFKLQWEIIKCIITHDYEYNESPKGLSDAAKAIQNCGSDQSGGRRAIDTISSFAGNTIGLLSCAAFIFNLQLLLLLIIGATTFSSYFVMKRTTAWNHKYKDNWLPIDRKKEYLEANSKDMGPAKDIRLYNMSDWFKSLFDSVLRQRMDWQRKEEGYGFKIDALVGLLSLIRECASYGLLIYVMFQKSMPIADFVLYFGLISGFNAWFDGIVGNLYWFDKINIAYNEIRDYLDYENADNNGPGIAPPKETFSVEFKNVSYAFKGTERRIFDNLNLSVGKGEKLAIVGPNGAGKTTLVKLICGLYKPDGGTILANGRPIGDYNISDYFDLFSVVFQDISILPMTIKQNIACVPDGIDDSRMHSVLRAADFSEKADQLPAGAETYLVRGIYPDAVDLSGGEIQKLGLARALYKDAPFLILDEPTAALDPIAENRIYERYSEMSGGKTSIFISHRLASTRFCDRIIYLEDGKIAEEGSHDELMRKKGKYYELFEIQSHYYKKDLEKEAVAI